LTTILLT